MLIILLMYFSDTGVKTENQADEIMIKFMQYGLYNQKKIQQYIDKCKSYNQYQWFKNDNQIIAIHMYMLCNIYHKQDGLFRYTVSKYFRK